jgi:hypothetical protein
MIQWQLCEKHCTLNTYCSLEGGVKLIKYLENTNPRFKISNNSYFIVQRLTICFYINFDAKMHF